MPECLECGKVMRWIQNTHLKLHNLTTEEYQKKYPSALLKDDEITQVFIDTRMRVDRRICQREGCENPVKGKNSKYCSYSCTGRAKVDNGTNPVVKTGKENVAYKDGATEHWRKQRKLRVNVDKRTCQRCGKIGLDGKKHKFGVHHIVPRKCFMVPDELEERDNIVNTMTLCDRCHKIVEDKSAIWLVELILSGANNYKRIAIADFLRKKIVNDIDL